MDASTNCEEIAKKLNEIKKIMVTMIVGENSIEYYGRAASYAEPGIRLVITKPDGTLLVHEASKREPLNWQPPGSTIVFECVGGKLRIRSLRTSPREEVVIDFNTIYLIAACRLSTTKLKVIGTEADIVEVLQSNPKVIDPQAEVVGKDISTPYGKIDLLLRKRDGTLIVVEVKNEKAGVQAVSQLKRYVEFYRSRGLSVEGVLVAPSISDEAYNLLAREGFKFISTKDLSYRSRTTLESFFKR